MKAEALIQDYRKTNEGLYKLHLRFLETGEGAPCLNPEVLKTKINKTDKEILEELEGKGFYIIDKEEYLLKKRED